MGENKGFIVYHSYRECFEDLSDEEVGILFKAMLSYSETGEMPEMPKPLKVAFRFIKQQMDANKEKYIEKCNKRSEAGAKGGRPRKETQEEKANGFSEDELKAKKANGFSEKQTKAKKADKEEDKEEDNLLPNGNKKEISPNGDIKKKAAEPQSPSPEKESAEQRCKSDYRIYGEFKKVKLLETEYSKLAERMGKSSCEDYIARLDGWLAEGNTKKNHYATILNWWRRDESNRKSKETNISKLVSQREDGYGEEIYADLDKLEV